MSNRKVVQIKFTDFGVANLKTHSPQIESEKHLRRAREPYWESRLRVYSDLIFRFHINAIGFESHSGFWRECVIRTQ